MRRTQIWQKLDLLSFPGIETPFANQWLQWQRWFCKIISCTYLNIISLYTCMLPPWSSRTPGNNSSSVAMRADWSEAKSTFNGQTALPRATGNFKRTFIKNGFGCLVLFLVRHIVFCKDNEAFHSQRYRPAYFNDEIVLYLIYGLAHTYISYLGLH